MNGMVCGILAAFVVSYMYGNPYLGVIILVAMVANMMIAAFVGFVIPVVLKACHADPAVASSIFITTFTDVCGFFIFLGLAKISCLTSSGRNPLLRPMERFIHRPFRFV